MGHIINRGGMVRGTVCTLLTVVLLSCNPVFPDYELDNFWKLTEIDYKQGVNYLGATTEAESFTNVYYGFARSLVEIHDGATKYVGRIEFTGDSLHVNYSMYRDDVNLNVMLNHLKKCGVEDLNDSFAVDRLDRKKMILSNSRVVLRFTRW